MFNNATNEMPDTAAAIQEVVRQPATVPRLETSKIPTDANTPELPIIKPRYLGSESSSTVTWKQEKVRNRLIAKEREQDFRFLRHMTVLWDVAQCSLLGINGSFWRSYCLYDCNRPDDGKCKHFWNFSSFMWDYTVQHPRGQTSVKWTNIAFLSYFSTTNQNSRPSW